MRRDEHFWRTANIHEQCSWVYGERTRTPPLKGVRMFATVDGYKTSEVERPELLDDPDLIIPKADVFAV